MSEARRVVAPYREVHMRRNIKKSDRAGERPGRTAYQEIVIVERSEGLKCVRYVFMSQRGKKLLDAAIWLAERIK